MACSRARRACGSRPGAKRRCRRNHRVARAGIGRERPRADMIGSRAMPSTPRTSTIFLFALALGGCDKFVEAVNQGAQAAAEAAANQNGGLGGGPKTDDDFLGE